MSHADPHFFDRTRGGGPVAPRVPKGDPTVTPKWPLETLRNAGAVSRVGSEVSAGLLSFRVQAFCLLVPINRPAGIVFISVSARHHSLQGRFKPEPAAAQMYKLMSAVVDTALSKLRRLVFYGPRLSCHGKVAIRWERPCGVGGGRWRCSYRPTGVRGLRLGTAFSRAPSSSDLPLMDVLLELAVALSCGYCFCRQCCTSRTISKGLFKRS